MARYYLPWTQSWAMACLQLWHKSTHREQDEEEGAKIGNKIETGRNCTWGWENWWKIIILSKIYWIKLLMVKWNNGIPRISAFCGVAIHSKQKSNKRCNFWSRQSFLALQNSFSGRIIYFIFVAEVIFTLSCFWERYGVFIYNSNLSAIGNHRTFER